MSATNRRGFLSAMAASGAALTATPLVAAPARLDPASLKKDTDIACVYHCDFGDPKRFGQMLTNMNNHLGAYEFDTMRLKLVLVAHGAGVKFFLDDLAGTPWAGEALDPDLYKRFAGLAKFDVEAYLCEITFKRSDIDFAKAKKDSFLKFVPSGVAAVAELQTTGYSYIKVG